MKHTPGPWRIAAQTIHEYRIQSDAAGVVIAHVQRQGPEGDANTRLIAAAPDLLAALQALYALVNGECPSLLEDDHHDGIVRAALVKAGA